MNGIFLSIYFYIYLGIIIFTIPFIIAGIALLVNGIKDLKIPNKRKAGAIVMTVIGGVFLTAATFVVIECSALMLDFVRSARNSSSNSCFNCPPSNGPQSSELMSYLTCLYYYFY